MSSTDTTFFTNEPGSELADRFKSTLKYVQFFDVLVGYFRTSGFYRISDSLKDVGKIRILVGLNVDRKTFELIDTVRSQTSLDFSSHKITRNAAMESVVSEVESSSDEFNTELGIKKFIEFLTTDCFSPEEDIENGGNGKKLEFRATPAKISTPRFTYQDIKMIRFHLVQS